ncbi:MAG: DUF2085 domain-containing protein [Chloroflexi bacterium]|nr:DUF2085 domain-containing protein [Chloroflexota bacterium]
MQINSNQLPETPKQATSSQVAESKLARAANQLVVGIARHWLALFNLAWGTYVVLPILAPIFMHFGLFAPAHMIYTVYSFMCHQLPDHSYFLFGQSLTPLKPSLEAGGMPLSVNLFQERQFIGNALVGYKVAICERDIAIYGSVLLFGLLFGLMRRWMKPLSIWVYILFLMPMAVDGTTQLIGLRQSDWLLRTVTGILFGAASVWLAYPYIEEAMQEVLESESQREQPLPA